MGFIALPMANIAGICVSSRWDLLRVIFADEERLVWGTFFETLNGMEEINLRDSGYDQSIFRAYAPGQSRQIKS